MMQQTLFVGSLAGLVATITWILARRVMRDDGEQIRQRLRGHSAEPSDPAQARRLDFTAWMSRLGSTAAAPFLPDSRAKQSRLRRRLGYAGIYDPGAIRGVSGFKFLLMLGGLLAGYFLGRLLGNILLGISTGALAGYAMPALWLKMRIRAHQRALEAGLPDALDLLVVCVEAGLTIDAAMQRVGQEIAIAHEALSRELGLTHMETRVGVPRAEALKNLGRRTGNAALRSLASMLTQSERFGTSIAQALRVQSDTLRSERQNRAEEAAAKASVQLSFPVVLFIFPAVLIVLVGPAVIGLLHSALFN